MRRGKKLSELEVRSLTPKSLVWILYYKDDNTSLPPRYNDVFEVIRVEDSDFITQDGEEWPINGNTSRGYAHYYKVDPV